MAFRVTMREWAVVVTVGIMEGRRDDEVTGSDEKGRTRTKVLAKATIRPGQSNQGQIKSSQGA